ncbi:MAG: hypothetical protein EXS16_18590 [Gemmataceae bacterium]|nr:hypothetical protein [Gemmataceae bacterium]
MSDATPENQSIDGEIREDAYIYALDQLAKGTKLHNIRECLIEAGYTPDEAEQIIQHAMDDRKKHAHELKVRVTRGGFQLIVGGLGLGCSATIFATLVPVDGSLCSFSWEWILWGWSSLSRAALG